MGAALAGGIGVGLYKDWSMSLQMNQVVDVVEPNPEAKAQYAKLQPIWDATYRTLEPIFEQLAGFEA